MEWPLNDLCSSLLSAYSKHNSGYAFTVAISGIDASGKGTIANSLKATLALSGLNVALISVDDWQQSKAISLLKENAAENFYYNSFRWHAFFNQVINPLKKSRNLKLEFSKVAMDSEKIIPACYDFTDIDIILIEGILLYKKEFIDAYDYKVWINCSFDKGLKRAIQRNQEGLPAEDLLFDYLTYYYPAQIHHSNVDQPTTQVDFIYNND